MKNINLFIKVITEKKYNCQPIIKKKQLNLNPSKFILT